MSVIACTYFDGRLSAGEPASLIVAGGRVRVIGRGVDLAVEPRRLRLSARVAHTPRWVYLPDGGACATGDNAAIDRIARLSRLERMLVATESHAPLAALATLLLVALVVAFIRFGIPFLADHAARRLPTSVTASIGERALASMEGQWMLPSSLGSQRRQRIQARMATLVAADGGRQVRLEFRDAPKIGPNAFALPGDIIVVTDQLVTLSRHDDEVAGVLAHELGHLRLNHSMRGMLESSAAALIVAAITGDIASTSTLAATAPTLLLQSKFSRDNESEADRFALDLMRRAGMDSAYLAEILERIRGSRKGSVPAFLASHPATEERVAAARAASNGARARALAKGEASPEEQERRRGAAQAADPPNRNAVDPALMSDPRQRRIVELVLAGDVAGLETEVGALQAAFEADAGRADELITAFHAFSKLPPSALATLDRWVAEHPRSHVALIARTRFHYDRGWAARGTRFSGDTPRENFTHMTRFFGRARVDALAAQRLGAKPLLAHRYQMLIAMAEGEDTYVDIHRRAGDVLAPASVETRLAGLHTLEPRWGGSMERMRAYVRSARSSVSPAGARRLDAALELEAARAADDPAGKLAHLDKALALDPRAATQCRRAESLLALERRAEGYQAARAGLAEEPEENRCLDVATQASIHAPDHQAALAMLSTVVAYGRADDDTYAQRGWRFGQLGKWPEAAADYRRAAELGNAWSQVRLAELLYKGEVVAQDRAEALRWIDRAAEQGEPEAVRLKARFTRARGAAPAP